MTRYRTKPAEIEAVQWTGDNVDEVEAFAGRAARVVNLRQIQGPSLDLLAGQDGAQGWVPVPIGHWIVRRPGDVSDHWPVDPDHFAAKYEAVANT